MNKLIFTILLVLTVFSCKSIVNGNSGSFVIKNSSDKVIEFIWVTKEGDPWPVAESVNIAKGELYELKGLKAGLYDIAIDFKEEYERGSNNSKFDKSKCLRVTKGTATIWLVDENGNILRD